MIENDQQSIGGTTRMTRDREESGRTLPEPNSRGKKAPTPQERKFVEGIAEGKTDKQAALDAGYSPSVAENTKYKLWTKPQLQAYFQRMLQEVAPPDLVLRRFSELMEGKTVTTKRTRKVGLIGNFEGETIEEVTSVNSSTALRAVMAAVEWGGYVPPKQPETIEETPSGPDQEPAAKPVEMNRTSSENPDEEVKSQEADGAIQTEEVPPEESDPTAPKG